IVHGPTQGRLDGPGGSGRGWRAASIAEALGLEPRSLPFVIQHDSAGQERLRRIAAPEGPRTQANGARRLSQVTVAVHDLANGLRAFAQAFGLQPDQQGEDTMLRARTARLPLAQGSIVLAAPLPGDGPLARGLHAHGEGLFSAAIMVDDLPGAVNALRGRGVGVRVEEPEGALVAARPDYLSAHGARLELVRA